MVLNHQDGGEIQLLPPDPAHLETILAATMLLRSLCRKCICHELADEKGVMFVTTSDLVPPGFRIKNIEVTFPMGLLVATHMLWPFALNPWFLSLSVSLTRSDEPC